MLIVTNFILIIIYSPNKFKKMDAKITETIDCKGLSCPMPMMKLAKAMKGLNSNDVLEMLGTDPGTKSDLPRWCEKGGHEILEATELDGGVFRFVIQKK